jgi:hypothetical protein
MLGGSRDEVLVEFIVSPVDFVFLCGFSLGHLVSRQLTES